MRHLAGARAQLARWTERVQKQPSGFFMRASPSRSSLTEPYLRQGRQLDFSRLDESLREAISPSLRAVGVHEPRHDADRRVMMVLSHLDEKGRAVMVDVIRQAAGSAHGLGRGHGSSCSPRRSGYQRELLTKGDALAVARVAGIAAAKRPRS